MIKKTGKGPNKTINKNRFPSLLKQLWQTEAIKAKTNIVKSFMKAGVFPLNSKSIDRSRVIKNVTSNKDSSANVLTNNNQTNGSSSVIVVEISDDDSFIDNNYPRMHSTTASSRPGFSSFASSRDAITALDQVLEDTISNNSSHNADDDTDEDKDCVPNQYINSFSIKMSSTKKQTPSDEGSSTNKHRQLPSKNINFDSSDEDNDIMRNLSLEVSQKSVEVVKQPPAENSSRVKQPKSILSRKNNKRKRVGLQVIGFNTSDEEDAQTKQSQQSLKAITDTLQAVFAPSLQQKAIKPTKRTMLKRPSGQIMTEEDVIKQLEEKKKEKISKQSRSTARRSNGAKRRKSETHGTMR
ncbi:unnamed protein product [Rotaria socialis]|nr:unnamed protein product [Rotaria socialis]